MEKETKGITIHRGKDNLSIVIFRKPTYTDVIIPSDFCHPIEHKHAAIRFLHNRLNTYQLSKEKKDKEKGKIHDILHNNGYSSSILKSISNPKDTKNGTEKAHWARFTYFGKETTAITKVLKNANIKMAYATRNTIGKLLSKKHNPPPQRQI
jgi:translation elongation factor EF-Ts